jgi:hypothetical protein
MEKESLTNEKLGKKFKSQFDLVNYAIKLADNMIRTGRRPHVEIDIQNPAMQILAEIEEGKDQFEEIIELPEEVTIEVEGPRPRHPNYRDSHNSRESSSSLSRKSVDRKRSRLAHS